jgi:hypothetical protein
MARERDCIVPPTRAGIQHAFVQHVKSWVAGPPGEATGGGLRLSSGA